MTVDSRKANTHTARGSNGPIASHGWKRHLATYKMNTKGINTMEKILIAYMVSNGFGTKAECIDLIKKHGFQKTVDACAFAEKAVPTLLKGGE